MIVTYDAGAEAYDDLAGRWTRLYAEAALDAANPQSGAKLLDVATGTADAALLAGRRVGLLGTVIGADLSLPMLQIGRRKDSPINVFLVAADVMQLPFANHAFQCATCLFGLMFFPDRIAALQELRRVLHPGGRAAFTTWERPERAPFAGFMAQSLAMELPGSVDEILKPFSLADPTLLRTHLKNAGFSDIEVHRVVRTGTLVSVHDYFAPYEKGGGRLGQFFLTLREDARERVRNRVRALLAPLSADGTIRMEIEAFVASGAA